MKMFVTGATGFVGSHFVQYALASGHKVFATHRRGTTTLPAPGLDWIETDLDTLPASTMAGCEVLVHFAAVGVSPKQASRRDLAYWNISVPLQLMESAREAGIRRVVMAGSFAEYGRSAEHYDFIPPNAPLLPTSAYAASKAACFVASHAAAIELELELCYLRIFSAYGEGQSEANFWPALRAAAIANKDFPMTAGEQIRDFVPIEQVAQSFLIAATRTDVKAGTPIVLNIGSGCPITIREFAQKWWHIWNAKGTLQVGLLPYRANESMKFAPLITE